MSFLINLFKTIFIPMDRSAIREMINLRAAEEKLESFDRRW